MLASYAAPFQVVASFGAWPSGIFTSEGPRVSSRAPSGPRSPLFQRRRYFRRRRRRRICAGPPRRPSNEDSLRDSSSAAAPAAARFSIMEASEAVWVFRRGLLGCDPARSRCVGEDHLRDSRDAVRLATFTCPRTKTALRARARTAPTGIESGSSTLESSRPSSTNRRSIAFIIISREPCRRRPPADFIDLEDLDALFTALIVFLSISWTRPRYTGRCTLLEPRVEHDLPSAQRAATPSFGGTGHLAASSSWLNFCLKVSRDAASLIPNLFAHSLAPIVVLSCWARGRFCARHVWCGLGRTGCTLKRGRVSAQVPRTR